jgi:hypothetical protein
MPLGKHTPNPLIWTLPTSLLSLPYGLPRAFGAACRYRPTFLRPDYQRELRREIRGPSLDSAGSLSRLVPIFTWHRLYARHSVCQLRPKNNGVMWCCSRVMWSSVCDDRLARVIEWQLSNLGPEGNERLDDGLMRLAIRVAELTLDFEHAENERARHAAAERLTAAEKRFTDRWRELFAAGAC